MTSIHLTSSEIAIAEHGVLRQIEEIRNTGVDVEIVQDLRVLAVVRIETEGGPMTLTVDPLGILKRLRNSVMN